MLYTACGDEMNKKIIALSAILLVRSVSVLASAPSKWAAEEVTKAKDAGITVFEDFEKAYTDSLNREEICELIIQTLEIGLGTELNAESASPFTDTKNADVVCAYELGIINGMGENLFMPQRQLTRQEASKVFTLASEKLKSTQQNIESRDLSGIFTDCSSIAAWAEKYVYSTYKDGLFKGDENGNFNPRSGVTMEQAVVICLRMLNNSQESEEIFEEYVQDNFNISAEISSGTAKITWENDTVCKAEISERRNSYYEGEFEPNITEMSPLENELELSVNPNKTYTVTLFSSDGKKDSITFATDNFTIDNEHRARVKEEVNTFTGEEDSSASMKTVTIKVWQLKDGEKIPSELTVTVLAQIADKVEAVFDEIFNGSEQFPIYSVGAYAWREPMNSGRYSEHNFGTAIDINPNENYCLYSNGSIVGECYKPYENPYSITPYGDVVKAFEKYGFTWGADSWRSPKDYMHFSYLGT